ncbi:MAG: hypothetical protein M3081_09515 [Gemmatimonadota bacterium]|nr:hypothetical protein [Gemmatimonadota bacterium]
MRISSWMPGVRLGPLGQLGQLARMERDAIRLIGGGAATPADVPSSLPRGHPPADVVRLLVAALESARLTTRVAALLALRSLAGEPAVDAALPAVRRAAESADALVREEATQTLRILDDARGAAPPAAAMTTDVVARRALPAPARTSAHAADNEKEAAPTAAGWPARSFVAAPLRALVVSRVPLIWVAAIAALVLVLASLI